MEILLPSGVFVLAAVAVLAAGYVVSQRPTAAQRRAARRLRGMDDAPSGEPDDMRTGWFRKTLLRVGGWAGRRQGKRMVRIGNQLSLAGYRHPSAAKYFAAVRLLAVTVGTGVGSVPAIQQGWSHATLWGAAGGAGGFLLPGFVLSRLVAKRQRVIRHALPDAVDIMVLSTEGGVSLQAALDLVAEEIPPVHPVLGAELQLVQREIQFGLSPGDAIRILAERCGLSEARDLAAAIQQGERYGGSMAKTLRTYSDTARQERQVWAEEMAQKAAVKILFPMLLCIFPAMFIVLLGPAAFQMSKLFAR